MKSPFKNKPIYQPQNPIATDMFIPNHSGIKNHTETVTAFDERYVNVTGDTMTGDLEINCSPSSTTPLTVYSQSVPNASFKIGRNSSEHFKLIFGDAAAEIQHFNDADENYSHKFRYAINTTSTASDKEHIFEIDDTDVFKIGTTSIDALSKKIINVSTPTASGDAATKGYVDSTVPALPTWNSVLTEGNTSSGVSPTLSTTDKLTIRDSAIYIHSPSDGNLDIVADSTITISGGKVNIPKSNNWKIGQMAGSQSSHTGNTTETALATITIPANTLGALGQIRIYWVGTATSNANNKTFRVRWGGMSGTIIYSTTVTTNTTVVDLRTIANRSATNSQIHHAGTSALGSGLATTPTTSSVDTTASADLVITGQLATSTDSINLEYYNMEYNKGNDEFE